MVPQFGSGKFTIMEKTADLTVVQKTITDTFHKEGKPQKVQLQKKLEKEELYQSKRTFKSVAELHKEWTEAGVTASRATTHRRFLDMGFNCYIPLVKPLLNNKQNQKHFTWAKEKKKWSVSVVQSPLF